MFRTATIMALGFITCAACNNDAKNKTNDAPEDTVKTMPADTVPVVSTEGEKDEKGCSISAGYRWSVMKDTCIRIFESGIKMLPKDPALDQSTVAYLVFSKDRVRVEIFLPTQKKAVIIRRKVEGPGEPTEWASGPLTLKFADGVYSLDDEGKLLYQGEAGK